jgi:hypothetical protein
MAIGIDGSVLLRALGAKSENPLHFKQIMMTCGVSVLWAFFYVSSFLLGARVYISNS